METIAETNHDDQSEHDGIFHGGGPVFSARNQFYFSCRSPLAAKGGWAEARRLSVLKNLVRKPAGCSEKTWMPSKNGVVSRAKWVGQCQKLERTV